MSAAAGSKKNWRSAGSVPGIRVFARERSAACLETPGGEAGVPPLAVTERSTGAVITGAAKRIEGWRESRLLTKAGLIIAVDGCAIGVLSTSTGGRAALEGQIGVLKAAHGIVVRLNGLASETATAQSTSPSRRSISFCERRSRVTQLLSTRVTNACGDVPQDLRASLGQTL